MKKVIALILALALCLGAVACSSENKEDNNNTVTKTEDGNTRTTPDTSTTEPETLDPDGTHIVTDHAGNSVEVPNVINRIVVADIYPMASVLTVFFDSAEKIVGMAAPCMSAAKNGLLGELYPEILNAKTDFIDGTNVNIEELLKLNPDVVFYSAGSKEEGEAYKNAGIPAIAISPGKWGYDAIETLNQWIETLVQLFPENNKAKVVRDYSEKTYKMV
ncbi:MAG: Fe3+-citrate ABC transporter substrate-binding protein, partial [Lachnospiraceae bacterium]|nr:Fe3+-citrate ABC transporter substrate-binding protein [Lachnospiraceae bacterium]